LENLLNAAIFVVVEGLGRLLDPNGHLLLCVVQVVLSCYYILIFLEEELVRVDALLLGMPLKDLCVLKLGLVVLTIKMGLLLRLGLLFVVLLDRDSIILRVALLVNIVLLVIVVKVATVQR
jgi:hypothetical protein